MSAAATADVDAAALWDDALAERAQPAPLLQSWAWGEVQSQAGWRVKRLHLPGGGLASVQLGSFAGLRWAYVPRGPLPAGALPELIDWARDSGLARLRVEPEAPAALAPALADLGFVARPDVQPSHTVIVALGSEEQMLATFKPKTRYNIRLAQKRGVTVDESSDAAELARQSESTAERQRIALPPRSYYELLLGTLPFCRTYVARHEGEAIAAILVAHHGGRAYYLFGGATGHRRELMPSYAVQWEAMRAAARRGCVDYDLWGVPPEPDPSHPWYGLWQFKTGFSSGVVEYAGCWDLALSPAKNRLLHAQEDFVNAVRTLRARR